jgi:KDO2-lipid IV(A) lauroyltransferase
MGETLGMALGLSQNERRAVSISLVRKSLRRVLDDLVINRLAERGDWQCEGMSGMQYLEDALTAGKGVVLVTGHFFASRLAKRYLASLGHPVLSIRNGAPSDPNAGIFGERFLQPRYIRFLKDIIRDEVLLQDPELTLKIMKRLREGGIVNVHLDAPFSAETVNVRFLGCEQKLAAGFLRLAAACGSAIAPMFCRGNSKGFSVSFESPLLPDDLPAPGKSTAPCVARLAGRLESQIRSYPDEWDIWFWRNH